MALFKLRLPGRLGSNAPSADALSNTPAESVELIRKRARHRLMGSVVLVLGAMFGVVRGVIFLLALSVVVHMTALHESEWWTDSKGTPMLMTLLKGIKPMLPEKFGAYLPD